jgi:elongation factor P
MQANDLRKGTAILYNGEIYIVEDFRHHTPGNKRAFVQASLRQVKSGKIIQNKFASDDEVEPAPLVPKTVQFLYKDGEGFHFMDLEGYHTFAVDEGTVGNYKNYLKENLELKIRFHDEKPIVLEFPASIILKVVESAPGVRGDSATNTLKPAKLETGYDISVPLFVKEGDLVKIDTRTGEYIGRG